MDARTHTHTHTHTYTHTHTQELKVSNCLNISDDGVQAIYTSCPCLSILVCHGCPLLTSSSREAVVGVGEGREDATRKGLKQITWTVY